MGAAPTTSSAAITASSGSQIQAEELRRLASQLPADELKRLTGRLHDDLKKLNLNQQQSAAVGSSANNSLQFSSGQHPLLHSQLGQHQQLDAFGLVSSPTTGCPPMIDLLPPQPAVPVSVHQHSASFWTHFEERGGTGSGGSRTASNERANPNLGSVVEDLSMTTDGRTARTDEDRFSSLGLVFFYFSNKLNKLLFDCKKHFLFYKLNINSKNLKV